MLRHYLLIAIVTASSMVQAAGDRTFQGRWNNRRTGSNGVMQCVASEASPGQWKAVFRGSFQGKPFEYNIDFQSKSSGGGQELAGNATISGTQYQWTGALLNSQLRGRYRAANGWNGEFLLNETAESRRMQAAAGNQSARVEPESIEEVEIKPIVRDGDHVLFIGNGFISAEGGLYNYLQEALQKRGIDITIDSKIAEDKPLSELVNREVGIAMMNPQVDVVVIISGDPVIMRQFATKLQGSGKKLVVFMTPDKIHPGNGVTTLQYTTATRKAVRTIRQMEKDTGVTIVPAAVLYHDLTNRPPDGMPRVDYLWHRRNSHQNALGTMASTLLMTALFTGESPAGLNFDFPPYIVGQRLTSDTSLRLTRDLREELQYRAWAVAQSWTKGKSHLE